MVQVVVFVVLVFAVPWIVGPWLPQQPQNTWEVILSFLPGVWAPTVIAIAMITVANGVSGLRREIAVRFRYKSAIGIWLLAAVSIPALITLAGVLVARAAGDGQPFIPLNVAKTVVLNAITTGAVGEEFGWRGFLLSRLFMASLFYRTDGSVIPTIAAHLSLNISLGLGGAQLSSSAMWWALATIYVAVAVVMSRARLVTSCPVVERLPFAPR